MRPFYRRMKESATEALGETFPSEIAEALFGVAYVILRRGRGVIDGHPVDDAVYTQARRDALTTLTTAMLKDPIV